MRVGNWLEVDMIRLFFQLSYYLAKGTLVLDKIDVLGSRVRTIFDNITLEIRVYCGQRRILSAS